MYQLKNYMEDLVGQALDEVLSGNSEINIAVRHSPAMRAEVMVEVLNNLKPFYVTRKEGEVYGFSHNALPQKKADIMIEIAKAIEVVSQKGYN